jgi:hypothetical protein
MGKYEVAEKLTDTPRGVVPAATDKVVWASAESLFVLTHDLVRCAHTLWRLAPAAGVDESAALAPFDDIARVVGLTAGGGAGAGWGRGGESGGSGGAIDVDVDMSRESGDSVAASSSSSLPPQSVFSQAEHPRISMTCVWTEAAGVATEPASLAAVTHDDDGTPVLVLLNGAGSGGGAGLGGGGGDLLGIHLDNGGGEDGNIVPRIAFRLSGIASAVAVVATRAPLLDLLVVEMNNAHVGAGKSHVTAGPSTRTRAGAAGGAGPGAGTAVRASGLALFCGARRVVTWPGALALAGGVLASVESVVRLHSPVGARVTAVMKDGRAVRLTAPAAPSSPRFWRW